MYEKCPRLTCEPILRGASCIVELFQRKGIRLRTGHLRKGYNGRRGRGNNPRMVRPAQQPLCHLISCINIAREKRSTYGEPTRTEVSDSLATFQDNTCSFMSDNAVTLENQFSNATSFPKVKIGTFKKLLVKASALGQYNILPADSSCFYLKQNFSLLWGIHRRINGLELVIGCDLERRVGERCDNSLCRTFGRGCGCGGIETGTKERGRHDGPKSVFLCLLLDQDMKSERQRKTWWGEIRGYYIEGLRIALNA